MRLSGRIKATKSSLKFYCDTFHLGNLTLSSDDLFKQSLRGDLMETRYYTPSIYPDLSRAIHWNAFEGEL